MATFSFLPEIFFSIAITLFFLMCILMRVLYRIGDRIPLLSIFSFSFSLIAITGVYFMFINTPAAFAFSMDISLFTVSVKAYLAAFTFIMLLVVYPVIRRISNEYYLLILFSLLASFFLISANDFIILYLALELSSFCFFVLIGTNRNSLLSCEASLKYFIFSTLSSIFLLLGVSMLYSITGSINLTDLRRFCVSW